MSLLRTFIALDIPAQIRQLIHSTVNTLRKEAGTASIRWVVFENIHLTLKFLGDVSSASMDQLTQAVYREAALIPVFDIHIGGFGSFPSLRRARVLYIGIQAPAELEALYRGIESACGRLGYPAEIKDFHPHLTIGRIKQGISATEQQKIRHLIESTTVDSLGIARVDLVHLYKSDLKPSGAEYTKLFSAPLKH